MPSLPALFSDHAVLQRDRLLPVWGCGEPGEWITVACAGATAAAAVDADGRWRATLPPLRAGGPHRLVVEGDRTGRIERDGILVGEVWLCSGQSNMEWPASGGGFAPAALTHVDQPRLRLFAVPRAVAAEPAADVDARWTPATPDAVASFSATAFAFGRELERRLGVPVGLVHASWGGTLAEAWTSAGALRAEPALAPIAARIARFDALPAPDSEAYRRLVAEQGGTEFHRDPGIAGHAADWHRRECDDSAWETMPLPTMWQAHGLAHNGAVWFRTAIDLPPALRGRPLVLHLGAIDDFDRCWVDGEAVGGIGPENPNAYRTPRRYALAAERTRGERLVVAVRVFDHLGGGGFAGPAGEMRLVAADGSHPPIRLARAWRYRVELALPLRNGGGVPPHRLSQDRPAGLFNAMIAPLVPYALRGAIWYQGESNAGRAWQYRDLLAALVRDWRSRFGGAFPFLVVGLANHQPRSDRPGPSAWAELRDAQLHVARSLADVHVATTLDSGEGGDIHPRNKPLVGLRLALLARALVHGEDVVWSGPACIAVRREDDALRVRFDHADGLHAVGGPPVRGFQLAGADGAWQRAEGRIEGDTVVVHSDAVPDPVAVRYAWEDNPDATLFNAHGLPAHPFRSDDWPLSTVDAQ